MSFCLRKSAPRLRKSTWCASRRESTCLLAAPVVRKLDLVCGAFLFAAVVGSFVTRTGRRYGSVRSVTRAGHWRTPSIAGRGAYASASGSSTRRIRVPGWETLAAIGRGGAAVRPGNDCPANPGQESGDGRRRPGLGTCICLRPGHREGPLRGRSSGPAVARDGRDSAHVSDSLFRRLTRCETGRTNSCAPLFPGRPYRQPTHGLSGRPMGDDGSGTPAAHAGPAHHLSRTRARQYGAACPSHCHMSRNGAVAYATAGVPSPIGARLDDTFIARTEGCRRGDGDGLRRPAFSEKRSQTLECRNSAWPLDETADLPPAIKST